MRTVQVQEITEQIREMCILVNHELSQDMQEKLARSLFWESRFWISL